MVKRINSKAKGSAGELELVHKINEFGFNTRRSQQFCGRSGESADLLGLPGIHIECKRVENLNIDEALEQAYGDASNKPVANEEDREIPAVFHRKNKKDWKVTLYLEDFIALYKGWINGRK